MMISTTLQEERCVVTKTFAPQPNLSDNGGREEECLFCTHCSDSDERVLRRPLRVCEEVDLRVDVDLLRRFRATPANVTCFQNVGTSKVPVIKGTDQTMQVNTAQLVLELG